MMEIIKKLDFFQLMMLIIVLGIILCTILGGLADFVLKLCGKESYTNCMCDEEENE